MAVSRELLYQILEYPLVTYITLIPRTIIATDNNRLPFPYENIELILDPNTLEQKLRSLGLTEEKQFDFKNDLAMLATNLEILDLKYRTIKITAVAKQKANFAHLMTFRKSYFYNNKLYINAYNTQGRIIPIPTRIYQIN